MESAIFSIDIRHLFNISSFTRSQIIDNKLYKKANLLADQDSQIGIIGLTCRSLEGGLILVKSSNFETFVLYTN